MTRASDANQNLRRTVEARELNLDVKNTQHGIIVLPTFKNAIIWLRTDEKLKGLFQYNIFLSRTEITKMPPWGMFGDYPKAMDDADVISLKTFLIETYRVEFSVTTLSEALVQISHEKSYDPVRDYLNSLKWDGVERVKSWLFDYAKVEPSAYTEFVGKITLVAAVARIFKPGIKYDYMLVLEGAQDIGKSMLVKALGGNYYKEISMTERDKETVEKLQGAWIVEVAELAVFKKRDIESLKAFITCAEDMQRLPYERRSKTFPRRNIFIGTINPDNNGYLSDSTGNRRFLPVECLGNLDVVGLQKVRDQLWAEACCIFHSGFDLYLPKDSEIAAQALQTQTGRQTQDEWTDLIAHYLIGKDKVRGIDIWTECLKGFSSDFDRFKQVRVADCMMKLGWLKGNFRFDGVQRNGYRPKDESKLVDNDESGPWEET